MNGKQRLELTWIGKENRPRLEPRILLEDPKKSHHAAQRVLPNDIFDNRLIFGDNLLALKALEQEFTGKEKCVFIDPPYNTGSAFTHYDDGLEHSIWLSLMRDRLELLRRLLREDGSIWITLDDNEAHYLKVLCDEIFGRGNFIASVIWRKNYAPKSSAKHFSTDHDYVFVYAKNEDLFVPNPMPRSVEQDVIYKNPDDDPRGRWRADNLSARNAYSLGIYPVKTPSGKIIPGPPNGRFWAVSEKKMKELDADNRIWWGKEGKNTPSLKRFLSEVKDGRVPQTFWSHEEVGHTQDAKREMISLNETDVFSTPKPEALLSRILIIGSNPGDLVLDSFAGSGTTGAVAHKMGPRWIMIELGEHIHSHIIPRMKKVIDGQDPGGVTEATGWKGGGGFRYFRLAPSLLELDRFGNHIISGKYNAAMMAEAMCKLMSYTYQPDQELYWQQGRSTETDFLYTTTQTLSRQQIESLSEEVGPNRTLMVCCSAFRAKAGDFPNLTLKKIPMAVLARCEWGKDDYSLNVKNLPQAPLPPEHPDHEPLPESAHADRPPASPADARRRRAAAKKAEPSLFGETEGAQ